MDEKNHFDLIFCVLACAKNEKYINRLKNFIEKYGYKWKNFNFKIKIVFLVEDEQKPSFINDDFIWYNCPNTPLGLRIINYIKNLKLETKWIMQVDDDSSTDLDKTLELLNQFYDCEDSMVLMGGRNTDLEMGLQFVLRKMKINNFFFDSADVTKFNYVPYFIHAWEPSIFSQKAIKKIKEWDKLEEFEDLCHFYKPVFSDQAPYVLAKIIKIPIVECLFLSPFNSYDEYSAINANGRFSHIHYVLEKDSGYLNLISLLEKSEVIEKNRKIYTNFGLMIKYLKEEDS